RIEYSPEGRASNPPLRKRRRHAQMGLFRTTARPRLSSAAAFRADPGGSSTIPCAQQWAFRIRHRYERAVWGARCFQVTASAVTWALFCAVSMNVDTLDGGVRFPVGASRNPAEWRT